MKPIVGIVADRQRDDGVDMETLRTRYIEALRKSARVTPVILPTDLEPAEVEDAISRIDGLVLGGAVSNVHPRRYGQGAAPMGEMLLDVHRDKTAFAAIDAALARGIPILGICRGLQELNVALGGSLNADTSQTSGLMTHTEDLDLPRDSQYLPVHAVNIQAPGHITQAIGSLAADRLWVNSLHRQAIADLATDLSADLRADDQVIEAVSLMRSGTFVAAVQWHPEWFHDQDAISQRIFDAFGRACRTWQATQPPASQPEPQLQDAHF